MITDEDYWWAQRCDDALFALTGRLPGAADESRPSRLLVAGGRQFDDAALMESSILDVIDAYSLGLEVDVVHGNARGADRLAGTVARKLGLTVEPHDADWDGPCRDTCQPVHRRPSPVGSGTICPAAGNYRNDLMVSLGADACLALPRGRSSGTRDTVRRAKSAHIPVRVIEQGAKR